MLTQDIRHKFLEFFKEKGHAIIPSASLLPENDPTVLFTTAGMHPLVPYLMGQSHPMGQRLASCQKCVRTVDIENVGDNRHLTFFEMLGNWSLGDYFKPEAIAWSFEFLTDKRWLALDPLRLYITVFEGDADAPRDEESIGIWQAQFEVIGIAAELGLCGQDEPSVGSTGARIYAYPKVNNWWGPAGQTGPCGPNTEMFYDTGREHTPSFGEMCHPNCDCGRFVEIWNDVFMVYEKKSAGTFVTLAQKNVDTGMGLERISAILQGVETVFDINEMQVIGAAIQAVILAQAGIQSETSTGFRPRSGDLASSSVRIITDHIRAATFIIGDQRGVVPSNVGQGYVVRRLIRRAVREGRRLGIREPFLAKLANVVIGEFGMHYTELETNRERIVTAIKREEAKFSQTLEQGLKKVKKMIEEKQKYKTAVGSNVIFGKDAFDLFQTYGFPPELIEEELAQHGYTYNKAEFKEAFNQAQKAHQELSRSVSAGTFKGGLADHSVETTRLHTATHLLHRALKNVLGDHVEQKGSNITVERLRFDFSHPQKMTSDEIQLVEAIVNEAIKTDLPIHFEVMSLDDAKASGALGYFEDKYAQLGGKIKVYMVGGEDRGYFSKEICGGPHVEYTGELGSFKIQKEEAVSVGVRRIKASVTGPKLV